VDRSAGTRRDCHHHPLPRPRRPPSYQLAGAYPVQAKDITVTGQVADADQGNLGYATADGVRVFQGTVNGTLATEPRGEAGFGYHSIFVPDSDTGQRTYAQTTSEEKTKISDRRRAFEEMRCALGLT
jgi:hypothetical protein